MGVFFASAGHASLIDYPDAKGCSDYPSQEFRCQCVPTGLQEIASKMYTDDSIISAVFVVAPFNQIYVLQIYSFFAC